VLELAAPFDMHPFRQADFLSCNALGFINKADNIAAAHIQGDIIQEPAVFALDHGRPFHNADFCYRAQRNDALPTSRMARNGSVTLPG